MKVPKLPPETSMYQKFNTNRIIKSPRPKIEDANGKLEEICLQLMSMAKLPKRRT